MKASARKPTAIVHIMGMGSTSPNSSDNFDPQTTNEDARISKDLAPVSINSLVLFEVLVVANAIKFTDASWSLVKRLLRPNDFERRVIKMDSLLTSPKSSDNFDPQTTNEDARISKDLAPVSINSLVLFEVLAVANAIKFADASWSLVKRLLRPHPNDFERGVIKMDSLLISKDLAPVSINSLVLFEVLVVANAIKFADASWSLVKRLLTPPPNDFERRVIKMDSLLIFLVQAQNSSDNFDPQTTNEDARISKGLVPVSINSLVLFEVLVVANAIKFADASWSLVKRLLRPPPNDFERRVIKMDSLL
ncbi:hypothetical protein CDAR_102531 [Caerostris darwini]|uniref:Uncharacterized protein n=1 Tax=Caerostris darwini TaxID=1538125 RepID=A0AAV4S0V6_9ARAC|nr:hypothetical protein CDAR_102531 [Caerostris darwini]